MNKFLTELRYRYISVVIFVLIVIIIIAFLVDRLFLASKRKKSQLPCYNQELTIWSTFNLKDLSKPIKSIQKYCLKINVVKKNFDDIKNNLLLETAAGRGPDIVYIDNDFVLKNLKIFEPYKGNKLDIDNYPDSIIKFLDKKLILYPLTFDILVLFVNKTYLANIGLYDYPKTFEEIENIIPQLRQTSFTSFQLAPISLGQAHNIDNFVEIFLTINKNLNQENYASKSAVENTLDYLSQFIDLNSNLYSWDYNMPNNILAFSQENLALLPAFYSQKEKIKKINPRLEFAISSFPKFQKSIKKYNYLKVYYFGVIKNKKSKYSWLFIEEFDKSYKEFINSKDLIPLRKDTFENLDSEKKTLINELLVGDYFNEANYEFLVETLPKYLEGWLSNKGNLKNTLERVDIFKFFKK
ncbi:MAG: hypothetical protein KatS3mg094_555 [Candidatus Parcubacteria bacterium]|nr:MAG: hypothetical protein KatS3mg094_555 [Candidatus Parcubacteria bacterium]